MDPRWPALIPLVLVVGTAAILGVIAIRISAGG